MAKPIVVAAKYRTNRLSHLPGGSIVTVEYADESQLCTSTKKLKDRRSRTYTNVKNPRAYAEKIKANMSVTKIFVDGTLYWSR